MEWVFKVSVTPVRDGRVTQVSVNVSLSWVLTVDVATKVNVPSLVGVTVNVPASLPSTIVAWTWLSSLTVKVTSWLACSGKTETLKLLASLV